MKGFITVNLEVFRMVGYVALGFTILMLLVLSVLFYLTREPPERDQ